MWSGEAQALEEGRIIPSWSMCSNSCLADLRRSGASRRGRAWAGRDWGTGSFDVVQCASLADR